MQAFRHIVPYCCLILHILEFVDKFMVAFPSIKFWVLTCKQIDTDTYRKANRCISMNFQCKCVKIRQKGDRVVWKKYTTFSGTMTMWSTVSGVLYCAVTDRVSLKLTQDMDKCMYFYVSVSFYVGRGSVTSQSLPPNSSTVRFTNPANKKLWFLVFFF